MLNFKRGRLSRAGLDRLAASVEHVAKMRGDGEGFDILSFEETGRERLMEVKTTKYAAETPFFVTANEVGVSENREDEDHLYRVYGFRSNPSLFTLRGALPRRFQLTATQYRASVR